MKLHLISVSVQQIYTAYSNQLNTACRSSDTTAEIEFFVVHDKEFEQRSHQPFENPEQVFRSSRKLSKTRSLDYLNSPEFNLISDLGDQFEEEET
ncbi:hypothetical protein Tco_1010609 [Tanacetum coccineum]